MKKMISILSAFAVMAAPMTAFADTTITETSDPQSADAIITTEIAPSYIVTIPADTKVNFNDTSTDFGKVELTEARLDPGKEIRVTVVSDEELNNEADETKIIPYTITAQYASGDAGEVYVPFRTSGQTLNMYTVGQAFALNIEITEDDWNKAYAGKYSDTVTFDIEYVTVTPDDEELPEDIADIAFSYEYFDNETGKNVPVNGHHYIRFEEGKTWAETVRPNDNLKVQDGNLVITAITDDENGITLVVYEGTEDDIGAAVSPDDPVDHNKAYIAVAES